MAPVMIDPARLSEGELVELNRRIVERLRLIRYARRLVDLARFSVGMRVKFTTDDEQTLQGTARASSAAIRSEAEAHRVEAALPGAGTAGRRSDSRISACRSL
jgi:hypothetical protein